LIADAGAQVRSVRNDVGLRGPNGPLFLTIEPAAVSMQLVPGLPGDSLRASDSSSFLTWYDRRGGPQLDKVSVGTVCINQRFALRATVLNVINGTPMPTRSLQDGFPAQDLILNIAHRTDGSSTLRYDAAASASDGAGSDIHTVTYTLTRQ
ncbi:MAG: hypothetical protein R3284_11945, partial [Rubricoccaceae bacterium]|nr:hypothetical protein [Rubricoccaceae bacterium]